MSTTQPKGYCIIRFACPLLCALPDEVLVILVMHLANSVRLLGGFVLSSGVSFRTDKEVGEGCTMMV